jgi:hypothetical protein
MGNKLARTTQVSPSEYYLHDLPSSYNLVLKEALGGGRFLKSIQCVHDEGLLLVKVYFKRGEFINLKEYEKKLYEIREKLKDIQHSHVWPFQVSISSFSSSTTSESSQRIRSSEIQFDSNGLLALLASIGWRQTRLHTCYGNIFSAICMIASAHDHF